MPLSPEPFGAPANLDVIAERRRPCCSDMAHGTGCAAEELISSEVDQVTASVAAAASASGWRERCEALHSPPWVDPCHGSEERGVEMYLEAMLRAGDAASRRGTSRPSGTKHLGASRQAATSLGPEPCRAGRPKSSAFGQGVPLPAQRPL
mmetsp:Transcript_174730/g.560428  ORF Transcript_174730/g.560428 Transcript_174730/m.560428 type:complete len:150 (+) Transcript_174730:99-548(+)